MRATDISDLRSALEFLASQPGQLISTKEPVDPYLEVAGVYRHVGSGAPTMPPTKRGPAMLFENVKGFDVPIVVGVLASRPRVAQLLATTPERLAFDLLEARENPIPAQVVGADKAPCQEVVIRPPFDIRTLLPALTSSTLDAGPFFNMGILRAEDPDTGRSDVTFHRLCIHGPDYMTVSFTGSGRHIDAFRMKAEERGEPLPVTVNMGVDPAICIGTTFEPPTTPLGFDELSIAGGLRGRPVDLVDCVSIKAKAIARAEIVLECEIMPHDRLDEDALTGKGWAMPEFPGYEGRAQPNLPVMRIKTITTRKNPILQVLAGPGEEHVNLSGLPTEASLYRLVENGVPGLVKNVYCHPSGGGRMLAVLQVQKREPYDEGRQRQAALLAFAAFYSLKHVILVDEDVDPFSSDDLLWAMTTRFQGDIDIETIRGVRCETLDPSATPEFNPMIRDRGMACKTIFDCTVPYALKERFQRAQFIDVDPTRFLQG